MDTIRLVLKPKSVPIVLEGEKGEEHYEIREMLASQRDQHMDALHGRMKRDDKGQPIITRFDGLQADLISRCLFKENKPVRLEDIQKWPSSVVAALYEAAQKLNGLGDAGKEVIEEIKKD